ncbi:MAG: hypothetical protein JWM27_3409 [Gemmatimonadetes bacterium]|nr:hypothetical protein [Gemmatimonadota bacterium]
MGRVPPLRALNLAPIEERWEAVESAEKAFRDTRLRVQSENVGLCRLPDGTRLIRVGRALPGELAAWRYGETLVDRRRRYLLWTGVAVAGAVAVTGGLWAAGAVGMANVMFQGGRLGWERWQGRKVVARVPAEASSAGAALELRRWQLGGARLRQDDAGAPAVVLTAGLAAPRMGYRVDPAPVTLYGDAARGLLGRGMVIANARGARPADVADALRRLDAAGSAEEMVRGVAGRDVPLGIRSLAGYARAKGAKARRWGDAKEERLAPGESLALEMALHETQERMALEGELAGLEAAWRQAEEIAAIADALPDGPLPALKP